MNNTEDSSTSCLKNPMIFPLKKPENQGNTWEIQKKILKIHKSCTRSEEVTYPCPTFSLFESKYSKEGIWESKRMKKSNSNQIKKRPYLTSVRTHVYGDMKIVYLGDLGLSLKITNISKIVHLLITRDCSIIGKIIYTKTSHRNKRFGEI